MGRQQVPSGMGIKSAKGSRSTWAVWSIKNLAYLKAVSEGCNPQGGKGETAPAVLYAGPGGESV